ncbi:MAG: serine hydrolase [Flavipsychrobacter sp.]|nr:serine hydrolase [Flavipsychrobacter sp.]
MKIKALLLPALALLFSSCHVGRFVIYNFAGINDHKKFPAGPVAKPAEPFVFHTGASPGAVQLPKSIKINKSDAGFEEMLDKTKTVAFLIIRNDSLLYEHYDNGYEQESIVASFSAAKSYVSALVGIAIQEGFIKSVNDPVTHYIPELDKAKFGNVTIEHLLDMRSGIYFNEGYFNPFGDVAKYYYGRNLKKYITRLKVKRNPGEEFEYISLNTQLLGMAVENATGKPLYQYLEEKLWLPMGMEYDASWSLDRKNGTPKGFCCLNARARDFAKFGRLYLNMGKWNNRQLVPEAWVRRSMNYDSVNDGAYSYQWWTIQPGKSYSAIGILGQYIYVHPEKKMVIVRLGKKESAMPWPNLFEQLAERN